MNFDGRAAGNEADGFNGGFRDADVKQVDQLLQIDFAVFSDGAFQVNADVRHICGCRRNAG
ncbi:unknown [Acetobacter sp. CAG:977]|nr:unknown [Acetobacter sp. CAG:977]